MLSPYRPHFIPSSPHSVQSSKQDVDAEADSVPIFGFGDAEAETVPGVVHGRCVARAASSEDPSSNFWDRTGSSESVVDESQYSQLRSDEGLKQPEEIVRGPSSWASLVMESLDPIQKSNFLCRKVIRYGDDCSGARGPLEALCQCSTNLHQNNMGVPIQDVFASECPGRNGDGPRAFIDAQCNTEIMFETVHRGTTSHGKNLHTGKLVRIPTGLTVYAAGWVCVDVSTMNRHPRPLLPGNHKEVVAGKAGASSQTLDSSLAYIRICRPDIALLENLCLKTNISNATKAIKAMGGYSTCVLLIDARTFAVAMGRRRMYLLAVQTHLLSKPLDKLVTQLKDIIEKIPPINSATLPKLLDADGRYSTGRVRVAMVTGKRKCVKWKGQHDQIRKRLGLPSREAIVDKVKSHSPAAALLSLRCQELLGLHWEVAEQKGVQPGDHHFVWDLTNSAKFSAVKDPRLAYAVPCALRGHCLWNTALRRPLSGKELMRVHGFCLEPAAAQLSDRITKQLAGDTISVPPVGAVLALALANTTPPDISAACVPDQQPDHHVPETWIGPSAFRGFDRSADNLFALAGMSAPRTSRSSRSKRLGRTSRSSRSKQLQEVPVISLS